ncbi:helix-turn-helix domain-containing protein [Burkholderia catarinensis]|uniref:helix-turn-helix domain-containing protein n=1 Tax=Burkholderia catarinensis TaxID=1108140 RepID=UPI00090FB519|nr:helix-turn-helix domain-containing protein [Burkholderia catarinensis]
MRSACIGGFPVTASARGRKARAQALIAEGRLSIKEIAQEPGFSDMSSFSQAYKRRTGVAPSVSRQETAGASRTIRARRRRRRCRKPASDPAHAL